ncbi:AAA family ATPase [Hymenobacter nivis]|uniref:AAA family ATPase n=1 Tax=Hymenobacter nivis TaxID=1850093 RepID=UPI0013A579BB|nr:AAA family ATPase [Hymenobacter nivis]
MENAIKLLRIQNFKSIKDVTLHPRRVNLIIGEPNVGKSNILEAMSLLGGMVYDKKRRFMEGMVRYEQANQLFFDNRTANTIYVETDQLICFVSADVSAAKNWFQALLLTRAALRQALGNDEHSAPAFNELRSINNFIAEFNAANQQVNLQRQDKLAQDGVLRTYFDKNGLRQIGAKAVSFFIDKSSSATRTVRPYIFAKKTLINQDYATTFLEPPSGDNLKNIIQTYEPLRREVAAIFKRTGHRLTLRMEENKMEAVKDIDGVIYSYPYSSVADTLQRLVFYLAAIESNDDAVLLFEEPEAHSFPVYVSKLGRRIVESTNNQFFIDTHSPYLITEILEDMLTDDEQVKQLAMFAVYYEDHQTKVHQLSDEEIFDIRADGIDVFYNMKRFTTGRADA